MSQLVPSGRIAAIMVHAPEPERALAWYEKAFPSAKRLYIAEHDFTVLQIGEIRLEIVVADEKVGAGAAGTIVYWLVEDFDSAVRDLQALGARLYRGPMNIEDGQRMCQLQDPWGNCIGIRGKSVDPGESSS